MYKYDRVFKTSFTRRFRIISTSLSAIQTEREMTKPRIASSSSKVFVTHHRNLGSRRSSKVTFTERMNFYLQPIKSLSNCSPGTVKMSIKVLTSTWIQESRAHPSLGPMKLNRLEQAREMSKDQALWMMMNSEFWSFQRLRANQL